MSPRPNPSRPTTDKPARILIADDHHLMRAGLRAVLDAVADFNVIGEACRGTDALQMIASLEPDLVMMDVTLPELSGLQVLERLRDRKSLTRVVMLSTHADEEHAARALGLGASGFLIKDVTPAELEIAVRTALRDEVWLPACLTRALLAKMADPGVKGRPRPALTPRQREVLKRIAEGLGTREIAEHLGLSVKTIETYRAQIVARLGIQDVPGLVRYAIRHGISRL